MSENNLLRPGAVSKKLGVSVKTLREWSKRGQLPVYFVNGLRRYRKSDVQQLIIQPNGKHPGDD